MFLIRRLHLKNFCQHEDLDVQFRDGVNVIVGPNGVGKSNLLQGIVFALTGIPDQRTKQSIVRFGTEPKDCEVELYFEVSGRLYRIRRNAENLASLEDATEHKVIKGITNVNKWVSETLQLNRKLIDHIYVAQGMLTYFFSLPGEKRVEIFTDFITDLPLFEKIWQAFASIIEGIEFYAVPAAISLTKLQALEDRLNKYEGIMKNVEEEYQLIQESLRNVIRKQELDQLQDRKQQLNSEIATFQIQISELDQNISSVSSQITQRKGQYKDIASLKSDIAKLQQVKNTRDKLRLEEERLVADLKSSIASRCPVYRASYERIDKIHKLLIANNMDIQQLTQALKFHKCPLCGHVMTEEKRIEFQLQLNELRHASEKLQAELQTLSSKLVGLPKTYSEVLNRRKTVKDLIQRVRDVRSKLKEYEALQTLDSKLEELNQLYNQWDQLEKQLTTLTNNKNNLISLIRKNQDLIEEIDNRIKDKNPLTDEEIEQLKNRQIRYKRFIEKFKDRFITHKTKLAALRQMDESRREIIRKNKKNALIKERLSSIRAQFHRTVLPATILRRVFDALMLHTNNILSELSADFRIAELLDNYEFMIRRNQDQFVDRLMSGGQKVILSIAFHIAKLFLLFDKSHVLILDEPTVFLDHDARANLCELLKNFYLSDVGKHLQIIATTHDQQLTEAAQEVICLT